MSEVSVHSVGGLSGTSAGGGFSGSSGGHFLPFLGLHFGFFFSGFSAAASVLSPTMITRAGREAVAKRGVAFPLEVTPSTYSSIPGGTIREAGSVAR